MLVDNVDDYSRFKSSPKPVGMNGSSVNIGVVTQLLVELGGQSPTYLYFRRIWVFVDAPHLLILIRKNTLEYGFALPDGTCWTRGFVYNVPRRTSEKKTAEYGSSPCGAEKSANP